MKNFTIFFFVFALALSVNAQVVDLGMNLQHADVSLADVDNDGDLDLLGIGEDGAKHVGYFINDGAGIFTSATHNIVATVHSSIGWGDMNGDGFLDLINNGFDNSGANVWNAYTNDGKGKFTRNTVLESNMAQNAISTGFADFNNDGLEDIFNFGNSNNGKCKLYFNNGDGTYTVSNQFDSYDFTWDPDVTVVDYDNDGDVDLFLTVGWSDAAVSRFAKMFVNDGAGNFTETSLGIIEKGYGSSSWADYDADGDMDLLINGDGHDNTGEASSDIYRLYKNNSGTFTEVTTFSTYRQISNGDGSRFADWDNDGDFDIIITGWNNNLGRQATTIFENKGNDTFEEMTSESVPGVSESSIEVGDVDKDGDLDLFVTGFSGNQGAPNTYERRVFLMYTNNSGVANTAPTVPTNISQSINGNEVTFTWEAASDNETSAAGLTYNLGLFDVTNNKWVLFPNSIYPTGFRMVVGHGNVFQNKTRALTLPDATYMWSVQAVDAAYAGSAFAEAKTFTVGTSTGIKKAEKNAIFAYPNPVNAGFIFLKNIENITKAELFCLSGKKVKEFTTTNNKLNVNTIQKGLYILKIRTNTQVLTQKITIE